MKRAVIAAALVLVYSAPARAEVQTKVVPYQHGGTQLEGFLAWDDASTEKRPGILVVHEWWGLDDYARRRAQQLARMGYVAFALDMYGKGKVTEHPEQAREWSSTIRSNVENWQKRALAGLEVLKNHELVDKDRLAAIGYCFGGSTVLQLAFSGAPIKGVVTFHGGLFVPTEEQLKRTTASILVCHGAADAFIPEETARAFREALEKGKVDYMMVYYGGARHSFTVRGADRRGIENIAYNRNADRRSLQHMRAFFRELFRQQ